MEEEYQESFGLVAADHNESVPSILRNITPPSLSDPPLTSAGITARQSLYAHRFASNGNGIYNEPCDARRTGSSGGCGGTIKKMSLRRASLATSIYFDIEHHRQEGFPPPPSPQGSSTYFIFK